MESYKTDRSFDDKYSRGGTPTQQEISRLVKTLDLPRLPNRFEESVERTAQRLLFQLESKGGYTETIHVRTRVLLTALETFGLIETQKIREYERRYQNALKKHEAQVRIKFSCDFKEPEEYL
jgi:hypothetical protein